MKKIVLVLALILFLSISFQINAQWQLRYPPQPTLWINDMQFLNSNIGYAVNSSGSILMTTDSGNNWVIKQHFQREFFSEIEFVNDEFGFVISPHTYLGDSKDFIFTTDGGSFWQSTFLGVNTALTFLPLSSSELIQSDDQGRILKLDNFFGYWVQKYKMPEYFAWDIFIPYGDIRQFNKLTSGRILALGASWKALQAGIISDSVSFILYSDDNGNNWDTLWCNLPKVLQTFSFKNNYGWMGGYENEIYRSTNVGISWQQSYLETNPNPDEKITSIFIIDSLKILAISNFSKIISTTNGGVNWDTISLSSNLYNYSTYKINFISDDKGFIYGPDFWVTTDGGSSWNKVDESPKPTFRKIQFLDKYLGFAVGGDGYSGGSSFYKTNNGGYTWKLLYQGNPNSVYDEFFMLDSLNGWLVDFNQLFKTTDGGINWNEVYVDSILEFIRGVEFYSKEFGILYEVRQRFVDYPISYVTTDGGTTWSRYPITNQLFLSSFMKIKRTDPSHIWFINQQGLWLSRDSTKTWTNVSTEVSSLTRAFDFIDSLNGWVAHMDGFQNKVKYTTDGGLTWGEILKPYWVQSMDLVLEGRDISGNILVTTAGLEGSLFHFIENINYTFEQISYTNGDLFSIATYREGDFVHKWIAGRDGLVLYSNEYITNINKNEESPLSDYFLSQNYPNPFNPSTNIQYAISSTQFVTLKVYDLLGREVATLVNEEKPSGTYNTQFTINDVQLSSGIYFYKLQAGEFVETKKMILLK